MSQPASNVDRLFSGAATHRGRGHDVNEDSFGLPVGVSDAVAAQKGRLYVVSDGIGGHQAGDVASKIAVDTVQRVYYEDPSPTPDVALQRAVKTANEAIYRRAQDPGYADMGATIVAAVVRGNELTVAHVGDSRVYFLRQGQLQALTADHSWVAAQVRSGMLTPSEAANHNMRHVVTRSLGSSSTVEVDVAQFVLHEGDRLLLCSDGIWELVSEDEVRHFLRRGAPRGAAQALVDRAVAAGVPDDATALVVSVGDPRSGVLAQVESTVTSLMATQEGRIGAVLVGALLVLALVFLGARRIVGGGDDAESPTVVSLSLTQTASSPTLPSPVPTDGPSQDPTAQSIAGDHGYCIAVVPNVPGEPVPAQNWDPEITEECVQSGGSIPLDEEVDPVLGACGRCSNIPLIRVYFRNEEYWIYAPKLGRFDENGVCQYNDGFYDYCSQDAGSGE